MPTRDMYYELVIEGGTFRVSRFGPLIASGENARHPDLEYRIRQCCQNVDWVWLEKPLLDQVVPGLLVYFFGRRSALRVEDLIFYWQD